MPLLKGIDKNILGLLLLTEGKCLDLLGRKVFSSSFHFRIANYRVLLAKCDFLNYAKFVDFTNSLP